MRILLLALLTIPTSLLAQEELPAYKIYGLENCALGDCTTTQGTCILLRVREGYGWFITVGHTVFADPKVQIGIHAYKLNRIQSWKTGGVMPDTIALLRTSEKIPHDSLKTYFIDPGQSPKTGDSVFLLGWPRGRYRSIKTHITGVQTQQFKTQAHLNVGASGGLVVYQDSGKLAGVIHGYTIREREGVATRSDLIATWLTESFPYLVPAVDEVGEPLPPIQPPTEPGSSLLPDSQLSAPTPIKGAGSSTPDELASVRRGLEASLRAFEEKQDKDLVQLKEDLLMAQSDSLQEMENRLIKARAEDFSQFSKSLGIQVGKSFEQQDNKIAEMAEALVILSRPAPTPPVVPYSTPTPPTSPTPTPLPEKPREPAPGVSSLPKEKSSSGLFDLFGKNIANLPWLAILGGLGIAVPGGAAGWFAVKGIRLLLSRGNKTHVPKEKAGVPQGGGFRRDATEAAQILNLRKHEQREPIHDALHGILWEDQVKTNPNQTLGEAHQAVMASFNNIAPLSAQEVIPE